MRANDTEEITIRVDRNTARAFKTAPAEKKKKMQLLLNLWLREAEEDSTTLEEIVHQASEESKASGLTPDILRWILQ